MTISSFINIMVNVGHDFFNFRSTARDATSALSTDLSNVLLPSLIYQRSPSINYIERSLMSFKATLHIEDQELNVLHCKYEIFQKTDHKGKPSARPKGGTISVLVESDSKAFLFDWATSETQTKSGSITFVKRDTMGKMKQLHFTDAYCVEFSEEFVAKGGDPMQTELLLSAKEISFGGSSRHKNSW